MKNIFRHIWRHVMRLKSVRNKISAFLSHKKNKLAVAGTGIGIIFLWTYEYQANKSGTAQSNGLLMTALFVLLFFIGTGEWYKTKKEADFRKERLKREQQYYEAYDELVYLIRERQHDLKNHISAILGMAYTIDNYEDLVRMQKEYCKEIADKGKEAKILLSSDSPLITGFLYKKMREAEEMGIEVELKTDMSGWRLWTTEYEIVEVLGILLDNAMEALEKDDVYEKMMYLYLTNNNIIVGNASSYFDAGEVAEFFSGSFSSKGRARGMGLAKLKKIVLSAGGNIIVSNEEYYKINFLQFRITFDEKSDK